MAVVRPPDVADSLNPVPGRAMVKSSKTAMPPAAKRILLNGAVGRVIVTGIDADVWLPKRSRTETSTGGVIGSETATFDGWTMKAS